MPQNSYSPSCIISLMWKLDKLMCLTCNINFMGP